MILLNTTQLHWARVWTKASYSGLLENITSRINPVLQNLRKILGHFNCSVIVEAGCGDGYVIRSIGKGLSGSFFVGIDYSREAVRFARTHYAGSNVAFILGDVRYLPLRLCSVDLVTSFGVIEHFGSKVQLQIICEAFGILKSGGFLFLETPNRVAFGLSENMAMSLSYYFGEHRFYTPSELLQLISNALIAKNEGIERVVLCRAAGFAHALYWSITNQSRDFPLYFAFLAGALFAVGLAYSPFFKKHGLFSQAIVRKA